ncbi:unnamed protein product [Nezara viridula]|uniref:Uncharacterized protein n=1 Tax=Nezara viridula TaxID=85310 RepID=A0A9P0EAQ7_NEZVI|nr:unnamed protein product [Nezara viridula]
MNISGIQYKLRGFIGFSGRRTSVNNVGHYTATVRRINETWEVHDDTKEKKTIISPMTKTACQILIYTI